MNKGPARDGTRSNVIARDVRAGARMRELNQAAIGPDRVPVRAGGERFDINLRDTGDPKRLGRDGPYRLKLLLKVALRECGFVATWAPAADVDGSQMLTKPNTPNAARDGSGRDAA